MSTTPPLKVGDIWYRVDGSMLGDEVCEGYELQWEEFRCERLTPSGGWFRSVQWGHYKKPRFALAIGCRWLRPSQTEALQALIARKRRQLVILSSQQAFAQETLELATHALRQLTRKAA